MEEEIMFKVNDNYQKLPGSYLFSTIAKKVSAFSQANPDKNIIRPAGSAHPDSGCSRAGSGP